MCCQMKSMTRRRNWNTFNLLTGVIAPPGNITLEVYGEFEVSKTFSYTCRNENDEANSAYGYGDFEFNNNVI